MKRKIIFSAIVAAIAFLILFAVLCQSVQTATLMPQGSPIHTLLPSDVLSVDHGTISPDGTVTLDGIHACEVDFAVNVQTPKAIELRFKETHDADRVIEIRHAVKQISEFEALEAAEEETYIEYPADYATCTKGNNYAVAKIENDGYTAIKILFTADCVLEGVYFYDAEPLLTPTGKVTPPPYRYILAAVLALLAFVFAFLIDKKFDVSGRLVEYVKRRNVKIKQLIGWVIVCIAGGVLVEVLFRLIFGPDSAGKNFNLASCAMFCAVPLFVLVFAFNRKNIKEKPERVTVGIILVSALFLLCAKPFAHVCWDIDSHYTWALQNSYVGTAYYTDADVGIENDLRFYLEEDLKNENLTRTNQRKADLNSHDQYAVYSRDVDFSLPHLPAAAVIAVARLFGASFSTKYFLGQIPNILIYAVLCYFAIKKLKSGKIIASIIALLPTSIYMSANYSYDQWVTGFSLLGVCYFMSELEQPDKPTTIKDTVIMCAAFALAAIPKLVYIFLMILPLFLQKNWCDKKQKRNYYLILITIFAIVFVMFAIRSFGSATGGGDSRGGDVNPQQQIKFILTKPFEYFKVFVKFVFTKYLTPKNLYKFLPRFSYLGTGISGVFFICAYLFATVTDHPAESVKIKNLKQMKILSFAVSFATLALIITALYISYNPVANTTVKGCQTRYLIPLMAPVALTIAYPRIALIKDKKKYNFIVLALAAASIFGDAIAKVAIRMF